MRQLALLLGLLAAGWAVGQGTGEVAGSDGFLFLTMLLLAVGLYGSTSDISLREAREHLGLLSLAVTVGVVAKAALIAGVLWLTLDDPEYLVLAVTVAQVDPLSVAALRDSSRMSPRAKTILSVWASFDDPVTVLLTAFTVPLVADGEGLGGSASGYAAQLGWSAVLVVAAGAVWWCGQQFGRRLRGRLADVAGAVLVVAMLVLAASYTLMLGIAVVGLFFRPAFLGRWVGAVTKGAYAVAAFLLGMLLVGGVSLGYGLVLGASAFAAHAVVASVLTRRLGRTDRVLLAVGQQNGVTAIVLALSLEPVFPRAAAIVAPAIVTVNVLHFVANSVAGRPNGPVPWRHRGPGRRSRGSGTATAGSAGPAGRGR
ncbi:cation:proton antiporter domain-containing protein [Streptomyces sp. S6]